MDARRSAILHDTNKILQAIYRHPIDRSLVNTYAEQLEKTITHHKSSQISVDQSKQIICENNVDGNAFLSKYNELKLQNIRELDPLVYILGKIKSDPNLLDILNVSHRAHSEMSDVHDLESVSQLQTLIEDSNSNALSETRRIGEYSATTGGYNSIVIDDDVQQFDHGYSQNQNSQHLPHYYATYAVADAGVSMISSTITKEPKPRRQKQFRQFPPWMYEVFYLSADFLPEKLLTAKIPSALPLETLPLNVQEKLIVQDILACLQGNDGVYIKALNIKDPHSVRNFAVDEKMHPSLVDTVNKVIPMISHYSLIVRFVEEKSRYEHGRVNQALCEAIGQFLQQYWKLLCQLETQYRANQLGISRLLFLLKDTGYLFSQLAQLATNINTGGCIGGATLSVLNESLRSHAPVMSRVHECLMYLMRSACEPYFGSLSQWIYRGVLRSDDAEMGEFFITKPSAPLLPNQHSENDTAWHYVNSDYYWERSYSIVSTQLPGFLESHAEKILAAGKYINVVQQCDSSLKLAEPEVIVFSENEGDFLSQIDRAHAFASRTLLDFILKQKDLKGILKSIKRYFLLAQGDFIVHFMDTAASELRKPISRVSISGLNSLLEWALRTSSADSDPYKDNLKVASKNCDLITQMLTLHVASAGSSIDTIVDMDPSALEAFSLDYKVDWPTALVINRPIIDRYQMLFRHLFYCRHVERHLSTSWAMRKAARRVSTTGALAFNNAFILGQRMLTYIQNLQYYMTFEVIEPNWQHFFHFLDKADNLGEVLEAHKRCLENCMDDCLLTSANLLALVGKLNAICIQFANYLNCLADSSLDDTLESVPMSSAASMQRGGVTGGGIAPSPSLGAIGPPLSRGERRRNCSVAGSDGGSVSLFRGETSSASTIDVRRRVAATDLSSVGSSDRLAITVEESGMKFHSLIVDLLNKIRRPVDRERDKLLSLASRLDFNGFYSQCSLASDINRSTCGTLRQSSSMNSLATVDGVGGGFEGVSFAGRLATRDGDYEGPPSRPSFLSARQKPPQPRDRRGQHSNPPLPSVTSTYDG